MSDYCTKGRLNKCFKYFKNKTVKVRYEYNNSLGNHYVREDIIKYYSFEIIEAGDYMNVVLYGKNKEVLFEQEFDRWWVFKGLGALDTNCDPYCSFTIKKASLFERWVK